MKIILTEEVLGLGDPGQVVQVKDGYGRNFLIPRGTAIEATNKNIKLVQAEQSRIAAKAAKTAEVHKAEAQKLSGLVVKMTARAGEGGKLYGSVTNIMVAEALAEMGHEVDRRRIMMPEPIKDLGDHFVSVKLFPGVVAEIKVAVEALREESEEPVAPQAAPAEADETEPAEDQD